MNIKENQAVKNLWVIFMLIAIFWPLIFINKGIDFNDVGYYMTNYSRMPEMREKFSIGMFLSNYLGGLIYSVIPSHQLMIFKILNTVANGVSIILAFSVMKKYFSKNMLSLFIMIGSFALSRMPQALAYNTISVLFLSLSVFILDKWICSKKSYLLVIIGGVIGISVFFRLPNVLFAALYFVVLWNDILTDKKKDIIKDTLMMLVGGISGIAAGMVFVICSVGLPSFIKSAEYYFSTSADTGSGHGIFNMLKNIASQAKRGIFAHIHYTGFAIIFVIALFIFLYNYRKNKKPIYKKLIAADSALLFVTAVLVTAFKYNDVLASIRMAGIVTIPVAAFSAIHYRKTDIKLSLLSAAVLFMALTITIGTDNGLYQHIIIFFWLMPYTVITFYKLITEYCKNKPSLLNTAIISVCIVVFINTLAGNAYNHIVSAFTRQYGEPSYKKAQFVTSSKCLAGIRTTEEKAFLVDSVTKFMGEEGRRDKKVLALNGLSVIFALIDNENLLGTSFWADLESCPMKKIQSGLEEAKAENDLPIVIIYNFTSKGEIIEEDSEKVAFVRDFCEKMNYKVADDGRLNGNSVYTILEP